MTQVVVTSWECLGSPCTAWSCPGLCGRRGCEWRSCRCRPRCRTCTASPSRGSRTCRSSRTQRRGNTAAGPPRSPGQWDVSQVLVVFVVCVCCIGCVCCVCCINQGRVSSHLVKNVNWATSNRWQLPDDFNECWETPAPPLDQRQVRWGVRGYGGFLNPGSGCRQGGSQDLALRAGHQAARE